MTWFLVSFLIGFGILIATTLLGRSLIFLLKIEAYRGPSLENFALSSFVGTAVLALGSCWLSDLGLTMQTIALLAIPLWAISVLWACFRFRTALFLPERGDIPATLALLVALLVGAAFFLFPLVEGKSYSFLNDTSLYVASSEYLQTHGFGFDLQSAVQDQTVLKQVALIQLTGLRMGAVDFLALIQALVRGTQAIYVFPVVSAWSMICVALALFYFLRAYLRLPVNFAVAAIFIFSFNLNPVTAGAMFGTLPQTFGLAALVWVLSLMAPVVWGKGYNWRAIILISLVISFGTIAYSTTLPFMVAIIGVNWLGVLIRSRRISEFKPALIQMAACFGFTLLLTNYELVRALTSIPYELQMLNTRIGINVQWPPDQYWTHAIGAMGGGVDYWVIQTPWSWILAAIGTGLCALGIRAYWKTRSDWLALTYLGLCLLSFGYYTFIALNPWTGRPGQTWALYKMDQYAYVILFPFEMLGLYVLLEWKKLVNNRVLAGIVLLVGLPFTFLQVNFTHQKTSLNQTQFGSPFPVDMLRQMSAQVAAKAPAGVMLIAPEDDFWPKRIFANFIYPIPAVNSSKSTNALFDPQSFLCINEYTLYGRALEPEKILQPLSANSGIVDCIQPLISGIQNSNWIDIWDNRPALWLGNKSTTFEIWSGKACQAVLKTESRPGPSIPDSGVRRLRIQAGASTQEITVEPNAALTLPFSLEAGKTNLVVLTPLDPPVLKTQPNGDTRPLILGLTNFTVTCTGP